MQVSVIICTHNPRRDYLERTLAGLRGQSLSTSQWELLLVDNASRELVSGNYDLSWHPQARHVREEETGLTVARIRGIREARGELLIFVDDDNVLSPDYVAQAQRLASQRSELGCFGAGLLEPEFEVEPPSELRSRLQLLALRNVAEEMVGRDPRQAHGIPWGAGLCVRRAVGEEFIRLIQQLRATVVLGRRGNQLFSGEDDLFSWGSVRLGLAFGVFPGLRLRHLISRGRLTREYFRRLVHDHAFSNGVTRRLLTGRSLTEITIGRRVRVGLHALRNGIFSAQCQWAESCGEAAAARFIRENGLAPLDLLGQGASTAAVKS
jgi:glycosyltransferase involved in cell wall biosynthesis